MNPLRHVLLIALSTAFLVATAVTAAHAQGQAPAVDIFIGGSRLYGSAPYHPLRDDGLTLGASANINRFLGVETSMSWTANDNPAPPAYGDSFRFLAGPRFQANGDRHFSPFAHFLVGVTHGTQNCNSLTPPPGCQFGDWELPATAFTTAIGAGLDVKVLGAFWIRVLQVDYFHENYPGAGASKFQLSFGAVFRFGSRGKARK